MNTYIFKILAVLWMVLPQYTAISQNENNNLETLKTKDTTYFSASINFISDAVFMGRKDSIAAPYLYPLVTYHHKSGFYASGSLSYLTSSEENRIDLFLITTGFDYYFKKLNADLSATKYFFNEDSYNVISEVEVDITALLKYDFDIINLALGTSLYFNSDGSSDLILTPEISSDFVSKNQKFQVSPSVGLYYGSQNFYEQYYINNSNGQGQGQGSNDNTQTEANIVIQETEKFNLMAIEFSLPMWYVEKSLTFSFVPTFVISQNPATLIVEDIPFEEDLESTFYWMIGIDYKF